MWRDEAYLLDILIAARQAREYLTGLSWEEFSKSGLHQDAVVRKLEIIGEAASKTSPGFKDIHSQIPWYLMAGMRNRLIHEYFRVDLQKVWETVQKDLLDLINLIEPLVPSEDE